MAEAHARHFRMGLIVAGLVFLLDQAIKWAIVGPLALRERLVIEMLPIFDLRWVENRGVSMGFLTADTALARWLLVGMTGLIATGVTIWLYRERNRTDATALGLVLGGALGNILDRVRFGYVADFLDLHFGNFRPFLVFNVADAAISIGVLLLVLRALLTRESGKSEKVNA
ncbi:signal peptidase II [Sphingomonas jatrophae]|uniref:Lipoprotein signal peptidase n=1 Tax=Sphingomonas jatrophae TaxID=1166337 RepID=A0A1I6JPX5_9SPHN|nr:signal peptidase II [Sphingomonas jatrophae]SFR81032.1 signal peptidase II [Sphingomonas jatrophae]